MNTLLIVFNQSGLLWLRLFSVWSVAYALLVAYKQLLLSLRVVFKSMFIVLETLCLWQIYKG